MAFDPRQAGRGIRNPVPRPNMSISDAMKEIGDFDPNKLPGQIDQSEMLRLLAQNTELNPARNMPPDLKSAVIEGRKLNPELQDNDNTQYAPTNPRNRSLPDETKGLPEHIREKMKRIDDLKAGKVSPQAYNRSNETNDDLDEKEVLSGQGFDDLKSYRRAKTQLPDEETEAVERTINNNRRVITNQPNAPRNPPKISDEERRQAEAKRNEENKTKVYAPTKPRFVIKQVEKSGNYLRINLLSGSVFYNGADVQIRKFNLTDAVVIQKAKENQDVTLLIDAVGASLSGDFDVRDLTMGDFMQLMYWHRFNSYPSIPFILNWTSQYGNAAQYRLLETEIQSKPMAISEEDLQPWLEQGYTVPRVRDHELFQRETFLPEEQYLITRAQYFTGVSSTPGEPPSIQDKIDMMTEKASESLDAVAKISEFSQLTDHGIIERVLLKDDKFNRLAYLNTLNEQKALLDRHIERLIEAEDENARRESLMLEMQLDELEERIEKYSQEGAAAEVEDVKLNIPLLNFFPSI